MAELPAPLEREWLWAALQTLIDARGEQAFLTAPILLPTDRDFPDPWTPDEHGVARIAERLLDYGVASQLAVRGYDRSVIAALAKHVPANQRATIKATVAECSREVIANGLGFDVMPEPSPPPAIEAKSWWQRLFG